jgi:hypothetical protein
MIRTAIAVITTMDVAAVPLPVQGDIEAKPMPLASSARIREVAALQQHRQDGCPRHRGCLASTVSVGAQLFSE